MTRHLLGRGVDVHGIDINEEAINWTKSKLDRDRFSLCGKEANLPYGDNEFDYIYAGSVITHIDIPGQFEWMRELHRVLKPNGFILLTFHGTFHFRSYIDQNKASLYALNDTPYILAGSDENSNQFGVAQTVNTLDVLLFGFERKIHFQCDDILGAQDTVVFQKTGAVKYVDDESHTHVACLLHGSKSLPRDSEVEIENLGNTVISGGIPNNYYLVHILASSGSKKPFRVTSPSKIVSICSYHCYEALN